MSDNYDSTALIDKIYYLEAQLTTLKAELETAKEQRNKHLVEDVEHRQKLEAENARYREALELLCYSNAGTIGTKTNAELPEWPRARFKEANLALNAPATGEGGTK